MRDLENSIDLIKLAIASINLTPVQQELMSGLVENLENSKKNVEGSLSCWKKLANDLVEAMNPLEEQIPPGEYLPNVVKKLVAEHIKSGRILGGSR